MTVNVIVVDMYRVVRTNIPSMRSLLYTRSTSYSSRLPQRDVAVPQMCKELFDDRIIRHYSGPSGLHADTHQLNLPSNYDIKDKIHFRHAVPDDIKDKIHFRHAVPDDIKHLVEMTQEEGWWYTAFEYNVLLKLDPLSFTVAADDNNIPVGFMGVCKVLPGITYNGPFIVRTDFRGTGIGNIFNKIMKELQLDSNGCMDLDYDFVEHYVQKGFKYKSYKSKLFKVVISDNCRDTKEKASKSNIVPVTNELFPFVLEYDRCIYRGLDRERILRACLFGYSVHTVAAICDGKVKGYGSLTQITADKYSISTLFADNENVVEEILGNMIELMPNGATLIMQLIADKQLPERFSKIETVWLMQRIYNKYNIETDLERMYYVNDYML